MNHMPIEGYLFRFFSKAKYLKEFINGNVRMMSSYYYATLEFGGTQLFNNRFDLTEGISYVINNPSCQATKRHEKDFDIVLGQGVKRICINSANPNDDLKLSCYYYIDKSMVPNGNLSTELKRMGDNLGDYYCLFINPAEFALRCKHELDSRIVTGELNWYKSGFVNYKSLDVYQGFSDPFIKPDGLSWQNEYRYVVRTIHKPDPFYLNIGSIKDIIVCGRKNDLLEGRIVNNGVL